MARKTRWPWYGRNSVSRRYTVFFPELWYREDDNRSRIRDSPQSRQGCRFFVAVAAVQSFRIVFAVRQLKLHIAVEDLWFDCVYNSCNEKGMYNYYTWPELRQTHSKNTHKKTTSHSGTSMSLFRSSLRFPASHILFDHADASNLNLTGKNRSHSGCRSLVGRATYCSWLLLGVWHEHVLSHPISSSGSENKNIANNWKRLAPPSIFVKNIDYVCIISIYNSIVVETSGRTKLLHFTVRFEYTHMHTATCSVRWLNGC